MSSCIFCCCFLNVPHTKVWLPIWENGAKPREQNNSHRFLFRDYTLLGPSRKGGAFLVLHRFHGLPVLPVKILWKQFHLSDVIIDFLKPSCGFVVRWLMYMSMRNMSHCQGIWAKQQQYLVSTGCRLVKFIPALYWKNYSIGFIGGAVNFCLQKSRMPMAGLVYFC